MAIPAATALWFLPFVLPICFYVAWSDLRAMRIPNYSVIALAVVFLVIGLIAMPIAQYSWQLLHLPVVLVLGILFNAAGLVGAGDAKFAAAAAPFIWLADIQILIIIFAANLLAAFVTHRIGKYTALRRLAPDWDSWNKGWEFPMGLSLGGTLAIYLIIGAIHGT